MRNAENLEKSMFSAMFSASLRGFEPPTYRLGARIHLGNIYNSELIQVKENLDFSNLPVISCQNKKTENYSS